MIIYDGNTHYIAEIHILTEGIIWQMNGQTKAPLDVKPVNSTFPKKGFNRLRRKLEDADLILRWL